MSRDCEMYDVTLEFGVKQAMRDGTKLSSDIYKPTAKEEKFPVIITRSPYMTVEGFQKRLSDEAKFFASRGYVYIIQDCRGKNDSEGYFHPFFDDPTDGYDTLAWCSKQEWCNGSIGTIGASYQAWNQWGTALLNPPGLKTMVCIVSLPDPVLNVPYQNGALVLWMAEWMAMVEGKRNTTPAIYDSSSEIYKHLPLSSMDEAFGRKSKFWQNWINHPSADDYWNASFYQDKFDKLNLPVLHVSGWYDDDVIGTHLNYVGMTTKSKSESSRKNQKLIIGPWQHRVNVTRILADIDFGESALIDLRKTYLDWFDFWLKGKPTGIMERPKVDVFVMGENKWRSADSWPLKDTRYVNYFLHSSNGSANTSYGNGVLSKESPDRSEREDSFTYDPNEPCPNICDPIGPSEGPFDQRPIERRDDVLVYSSAVLENDLKVIGPVWVKLFASSSARDTDFWAELCDVFPSGYSMHLTEGIIRARYRNSLEKEELLVPGKIYEFNIDLWVTANTFLKGHKIRLDISSSSFPKYDRNPNTGNEFGKSTETMKATQKIFHNSEFKSHVVLPVV